MMFYNNKTHMTADREMQMAVEARREKEARERITEEFAALLRLDPDEGAQWKGSVADLMEAAHIAYTQGSICDTEGNVYTFVGMVTEVCHVLHVRKPHNPRGAAYQAARRKGVRRGALIGRYMRMMHEKGERQPLMRNITKQ